MYIYIQNTKLVVQPLSIFPGSRYPVLRQEYLYPQPEPNLSSGYLMGQNPLLSQRSRPSLGTATLFFMADVKLRQNPRWEDLCYLYYHI